MILVFAHGIVDAMAAGWGRRLVRCVDVSAQG